MDKKINLLAWLNLMFREFISEKASQTQYEVVDLYDCPKTGFKKAIVKLAGRHTFEKNISDIVTDMALLDGFDKKTIRTLTYIATVERLKPDYSVVVQKMSEEVDDYILEIKSRKNNLTLQKTPTEVVRDKELIEKFSPTDANRIGYLAGIKEAVREFKLKKSKTT